MLNEKFDNALENAFENWNVPHPNWQQFQEKRHNNSQTKKRRIVVFLLGLGIGIAGTIGTFWLLKPNIHSVSISSLQDQKTIPQSSIEKKSKQNFALAGGTKTSLQSPENQLETRIVESKNYPSINFNENKAKRTVPFSNYKTTKKEYNLPVSESNIISTKQENSASKSTEILFAHKLKPYSFEWNSIKETLQNLPLSNRSILSTTKKNYTLWLSTGAGPIKFINVKMANADLSASHKDAGLFFTSLKSFGSVQNIQAEMRFDLGHQKKTSLSYGLGYQYFNNILKSNYVYMAKPVHNADGKIVRYDTFASPAPVNLGSIRTHAVLVPFSISQKLVNKNWSFGVTAGADLQLVFLQQSSIFDISYNKTTEFKQMNMNSVIPKMGAFFEIPINQNTMQIGYNARLNTFTGTLNANAVRAAQIHHQLQLCFRLN